MPVSGSNTSAGSNSSSSQGPVGQGDYVVKQGDCVSSIAYAHGHFWETIWNHPNNLELKQARQDPHVLLPGDRVFIPEKELGEESGATEKRHRFRRKGVPEVLKIVVKVRGEPRGNERYVLKVDGKIFTGRTDGDGRIEHPIPPSAQSGTLTLGEGPYAETFTLNLGHLDPVSDISGVQARLNNLGFRCGEANGQTTPGTSAAIRAFQAKAGLPVTGEPDRAFRDALVQAHGS